jgi:hypothetical protein
MKILKKTKGAHGNRLEFRTYDHLSVDCVVVTDLDCQKERTYQIGINGSSNPFKINPLLKYVLFYFCFKLNNPKKRS